MNDARHKQLMNYVRSCPSLLDALKQVANEVEQEVRAEIESTDREMSLQQATELARLCRAGKLIGGDAVGVSVTLLNEVERLRYGAAIEPAPPTAPGEEK